MEFADLISSVIGAYMILGIIYFLFFAFCLFRFKSLFFNLSKNNVFLVTSFYALILIHCLARVITMIVSCFIVYDDGQAKPLTVFDSSNKVLIFLMFFPEILFLLLLFILYFVLAIVVFFGHITFISPEMIPIYKRNARIIWSVIIITFVCFQATMFILYGTQVIKRDGLIVELAVSEIVCPCFIILSEIKLHEKTSGLPYQSSIFKNTKSHLNFRVFCWVGGRITHATLCLTFLNFEYLHNFVEIPPRSGEIEDQHFYMILGSLAIVIVDKVINEIFPIYLVIHQDFLEVFLNEKTGICENMVKSKENASEENGNKFNPFNINCQSSGFDNNSSKIDFKILNFKDASFQKNKPKNSLGTIKIANCDKIFALRDLAVRIIELPSLNPYITDYVNRDCILHQKLQKLENINLEIFIGYSIDKNTVSLIYEDYPNGSLSSLIHNVDKKNNPLNKIDFQVKLKIALNIAKTMKNLHENNPPIIHGHLTPHNILLDNDFLPKISDLLFYDLKKYCAVVIGYNSKSKYTAPEYIKENGFFINNPKVSADVYSYALIMWELLTEMPLFLDIKLNDLKKILIDDDSRPKIPEDIPEEIAKLIRCSWQKDPENRPSFAQIFDKLEKIVGEQETYESFVNSYIKP